MPLCLSKGNLKPIGSGKLFNRHFLRQMLMDYFRSLCPCLEGILFHLYSGYFGYYTLPNNCPSLHSSSFHSSNSSSSSNSRELANWTNHSPSLSGSNLSPTTDYTPTSILYSVTPTIPQVEFQCQPTSSITTQIVQPSTTSPTSNLDAAWSNINWDSPQYKSVIEGCIVQLKHADRESYSDKFIWIDITDLTFHLSSFNMKAKRHKDASLMDMRGVATELPLKVRPDKVEHLHPAKCMTITFRKIGLDLIFDDCEQRDAWYEVLALINESRAFRRPGMR